MSVLTQLLMSIISDNIWTTITSLLIVLVVYKLAKFYYRYYSLPPGPFPLPIVGNLLAFRSKQFWEISLRNIAKNYGPVFTLHLGNTPYIIITDVDIGRQTFGKQSVLGRPDSYLRKFFKNDIIFADYSQHWEVLRRVAHSAVQKYSVNERLVNVAVDCVDKTVQTILETEGPNKPIDPFNYLYLMYLNIMATSCFSQNYNIDDPEFQQIKYGFKDFGIEFGLRSFLWEISAIIRWFDRKSVQKYDKIFTDLRQLFRYNYLLHLNDYDSQIERDFCDALIGAKNDSIREAKQSATYLTDDNLVMAVFDLFIAGTDSSYLTLLWSLLLLAYYPDVQQKLRKEIESIIGDRMPSHDDRQRCHYVMAFMAEILRYKNPGPTGFFHKAMTTCKIGDYTIPEGMAVFVYQGFILLDDKNFENPDTFKPERFIDSDGHYMTTRSPAFIPFGVGRRSCVGEKLAIADYFLVLVRFLQLTQNYDIVLDSHHGLDGKSLPHFNGKLRQQIRSLSSDIQRIIDYVVNGRDSGQTYAELAKFVDWFGPRLVGTSSLESSIDYMVDRLKRERHDKVYTENVIVPVWTRGREWAQMVSPRIQTLNILSLGSSIGTNGSVLTGDVIVVKSFAELNRRSHEIRGKFVVYNYDFNSYDKSIDYRVHGASRASKYGAIGALIRSVTPFSINSPHTGAQSYDNNVRKIPAVSITVEDAELFGRLAGRGVNITVSLSMEARMDADRVSRNTVSEITGSTKPDEVVLVSGHLDSWDVGQGAMDDGGGAFISWRALSVIKKLGLRPKRTVQSVLWTGEEMGLIGVQQYTQKHINELNKISIAMESDSGTFAPTGITYSGRNPTAQCIVNELLRLLKPINASQLTIGGIDGIDIELLVDKGVPGASLDTSNDRYFYYHHSSGDTMSMMSTRQLDLCTAVWAAIAYGLASIDDQLPR
ncbi:uncharacterized protein LOC128956821 [Oppia nitens]|uniref:uncharacterized protein LOC128956821 n=1 Tax=Oppia nitens TaxID=1686743 RepID=UPI0023DA168D|nr:uncharacterized protein LOC128956821 [Oppia nitens]